MYTKTLIAKLALGWIGDRDISDISDIYDLDSVALKTRYDAARDSVLVSHDWRWAKRSVQLQLLPTVPVVRFSKEYALPPNYARLSNVSEFSDMRLPLDDGMFDITDGKLITDANYVFMQYVASDFSEAVWPAYFADCVALQLAILACMKISHNAGLKSELMKQYYDRVMPFARSTDSTAQPFRSKLVRSPWSEARLSRGPITNLRR